MSINKFNSEGYYDPTTYEALTNIERECNKHRTLVYVCSAYAGDKKLNVDNTRKYSRFVFEKGYIPIAPHLLFPQFLDDDKPTERELGMRFGNMLMNHCSEMWVFGENISLGMSAEIKRAKWKNYKIRYFSSEMKEVKDNG